jgi:pantothenate kinase
MSMAVTLKLGSVDHLAVFIHEHFGLDTRRLIAIAGPPGAGKSTAAIALRDRLSKSAILQADGFHYDNSLLDLLGRRQRKGAPDTFDCAGLKLILERVRNGEENVVVPVFDRELDVSRGSADLIDEGARFIVVEGNYLASSEKPWSDLRSCFDLLVYLEVPVVELVRRLHQRWDDLGWPRDMAETWIENNDLPNIAFTERTKSHVDIAIPAS